MFSATVAPLLREAVLAGWSAPDRRYRPKCCCAVWSTWSAFAIIWRYSVPSDRVAEFVDAYGPDGDWVRLFAAATGYTGTELLACEDRGTFITVDRWHTRSAFDEFMQTHRVAYGELDDRLASLTTDEVLVGRGEICPPASAR